MKKLDSNLTCPACRGPLAPKVLACDACGIRVEGSFTHNEFASLAPELLHFLRIFVHCEGRIKDMEKALGVSYPTVKAQMAQLKEALSMPLPGDAGESSAAAAAVVPTPDDAKDVLAALDAGEIDYQEALRRLKGPQP